jgi:hypothetical protein
VTKLDTLEVLPGSLCGGQKQEGSSAHGPTAFQARQAPEHGLAKSV